MERLKRLPELPNSPLLIDDADRLEHRLYVYLSDLGIYYLSHSKEDITAAIFYTKGVITFEVNDAYDAATRCQWCLHLLGHLACGHINTDSKNKEIQLFIDYSDVRKQLSNHKREEEEVHQWLETFSKVCFTEPLSAISVYACRLYDSNKRAEKWIALFESLREVLGKKP